MTSRWPTVFLNLILPFILVVGCFPLYNRVEPRILGFPFLYAWIFASFGLVSISMYLGWLLDPASGRNKKRRAAGKGKS